MNRYNINRKKMSELLQISEQGFDKKLRNETLTVKDLDTLASYAGISAAYFFEENSVVSEPSARYGNCKKCGEKEAIISMLKEQLKEKEEHIDKLNREIGRITPEENAKVG